MRIFGIMFFTLSNAHEYSSVRDSLHYIINTSYNIGVSRTTHYVINKCKYDYCI